MPDAPAGVTAVEILTQAIEQHRARKYEGTQPTLPIDRELYAELHDDATAEKLCDAIEHHLEQRWHDRKVTEPLDMELYNAAVWYRGWQDHALDPDAPILD
jgi:hypothetical protein